MIAAPGLSNTEGFTNNGFVNHHARQRNRRDVSWFVSSIPIGKHHTHQFLSEPNSFD
jgi:hypothetical protein